MEMNVYDKEYSILAGEIELFRERRQRIKDSESEHRLRADRIDELKNYLHEQDTTLTGFDNKEIFRRIIEKVRVHSMVEVVFVFKTGVEAREIL